MEKSTNRAGVSTANLNFPSPWPSYPHHGGCASPCIAGDGAKAAALDHLGWRPSGGTHLGGFNTVILKWFHFFNAMIWKWASPETRNESIQNQKSGAIGRYFQWMLQHIIFQFHSCRARGAHGGFQGKASRHPSNRSMGVSENRDTHESVACMGKLNYDKPSDFGVPHFRSKPSPNVNLFINLMHFTFPFCWSKLHFHWMFGTTNHCVLCCFQFLYGHLLITQNIRSLLSHFGYHEGLEDHSPGGDTAVRDP